MVDRKFALGALAVGDIFHAECPNGASLICLTLSVTHTTIRARTVTTQLRLEFDRKTGITIDDGAKCTIDSVAALPTEIYDVLLGLDRKFAQPSGDSKLSAAEKHALIFVDSYYASNQL